MANDRSGHCERFAERLGGNAYSQLLDGWAVSWVSDESYRHICTQSQESEVLSFLVVMLNPGSLSRDGAGLKRDLTLRIVRKVFDGTGISPVVTNLFDLATPKLMDLNTNWLQRDKEQAPSVYDLLGEYDVGDYIFAYGDYLKNLPDRVSDVEARVAAIQAKLSHLRRLEHYPNTNGAPSHPRIWQTAKLVDDMRARIQAFCFG